jgi:hypothetical protein
MKQQLLIERFTPNDPKLIESRDEFKNLFLAGRIMTSEEKNLNGRIYPNGEILKAVNLINEKAKSGTPVLGELDHPDSLGINLKNVSHIITEAWMDGNYANGKCKVLNTPSGLVVQNLVNGGVRLGVSSRGTGNVNHSGIVEDFQFATLDIVAQPSGPGCYPDVVREAVGDHKIMTLAEAVVEDPKAQKYLTAEIQKFLRSILK